MNEHSLTFLYGTLPEGDGAGEGDCYVNQLLNRYCLSPSCGTDGILTYLSMEKETALADILLTMSFLLGIITTGDLHYYFGVPAVQMRRTLKELTKKGLFLELSGVDSFRNKTYYVYTKKGLLRGHTLESERILSVNTRNLKERSLAHSYGISLSFLTMSLYRVANRDYQFHYVLERSLGSMANYNAKTGAVLCADGIIHCRYQGKPHMAVYLEQDMDTERLSVLLDKLYQYFQTDIYQLSKKESCCILFSVYKCHYLGKSAAALYDKSYYIGLYLLFYEYLCEEYGAVENGGVLVFSFDLIRFYHSKCSILRKSLIDRLLQDTGICGLDYFGVSWDTIEKAVTELPVCGYEVLEQFLYLTGSIDYNRHRTGAPVTLPALQEFIEHYDGMERGIMARITHSVPIVKVTKRRHFHFGRKLIDAFLDGSSPYIAPMCGGYSVYTLPTHLLTNDMPYVLWDRDNALIRHMEEVLSSYYGEMISYQPFSPVLPCAGKGQGYYNPYDICLKHYYQFDTLPMVCVEDISADTSALLRSFLYIRYGKMGQNVVHLLLLVDCIHDAEVFYKTYIHNPDTGMNLSRAAGADVLLSPIRDGKLFFSMKHSQVLFLQKRVSLHEKNRLFFFTKDLTVISL